LTTGNRTPPIARLVVIKSERGHSMFHQLPWIHDGLGTQEKMTGKHRFLDTVHGEQDEWYGWQVDEDGEPIYPDQLNDALQYLLYEVVVEIEVDFDKNDAKVVAFIDGGKRYEPVS
jgi:hypothetical protein